MNVRRVLHAVAAVLLIGVLTSGCVIMPEDDGDSSAAVAAGQGGEMWEAGNIFSDQVFYNGAALADDAQTQAALDTVGATCLVASCLRNATYDIPGMSNQWCSPVPAETGVRYAHMLRVLAQACGFNAKVAIVMIMKESQGLTRPSPPAALTGFGCPDSGPGGSANCDSSRAGVWAQTAGLFTSVAKGRQDASIINYPEGKTHQILWNVVETGCGSGPVMVMNRATAWIYTYTPYQPNAASLAAYPGEGDRCSAYGNRNLFEMYKKWFGSTGGGRPAPGAAQLQAQYNGPNLTVPDSPHVAPAVRGKVIQTPSEGVAKGIAAGMGYLGAPYVWGGGGDGAGPNNGCSRGGGALNSCGSEIGFDCSGLTAYVLVQGGFASPGGSSGVQRSGGQSIPYENGAPGDIVGFPGHVAIYLGKIDGLPYILEASDVGTPIRIVQLSRSDKDSMLHRYWSASTP